jgi:hypothetical protein
VAATGALATSQFEVVGTVPGVASIFFHPADADGDHTAFLHPLHIADRIEFRTASGAGFDITLDRDSNHQQTIGFHGAVTTVNGGAAVGDVVTEIIAILDSQAPVQRAKRDDLFINTSDGKVWVFDGSRWLPIGNETRHDATPGATPTILGQESIGDLFLNTADDKAWVWDGTTWQAFGSKVSGATLAGVVAAAKTEPHEFLWTDLDTSAKIAALGLESGSYFVIDHIPIPAGIPGIGGQTADVGDWAVAIQAPGGAWTFHLVRHDVRTGLPATAGRTAGDVLTVSNPGAGTLAWDHATRAWVANTLAGIESSSWDGWPVGTVVYVADVHAWYVKSDTAGHTWQLAAAGTMHGTGAPPTNLAYPDGTIYVKHA